MPSERRKLSAVYNDFNKEIKRLEKFDRENQRKFSNSVNSINPVIISKRQLYLLTETLFFSGYRAYEKFLRDVFLLYCLEKRPRSGKEVRSYLKPKDFNHAELLIQSSMNYLDWSSPSAIISRAELYLEDGFPIKIPISSLQSYLMDYKRIRNHIAHNSKESYNEYKKTLKTHYKTIPLIIPTPGEFLLQLENKRTHKYKLLTFFEKMRVLAHDLTQ